MVEVGPVARLAGWLADPDGAETNSGDGDGSAERRRMSNRLLQPKCAD